MNPQIVALFLCIITIIHAAPTKIPTKVITINDAPVVPESIACSQEYGLFISCTEFCHERGGALGKLTVLKNGTAVITPFVNEPRVFGLEIQGILVDEEKGEILFLATDQGALFGGPGDNAFVRADIETGEVLQFVNFTEAFPGERLFVNDLVQDCEGNVFITESITGTIFRLDAETGELTKFIQDDRFLPGNGQFTGLNGIEIVDCEFLLVSVSSTGGLFKIPLDDPQITQIDVGGVDLYSADAIFLKKNGNLLVTTKTSPCVYEFRSKDDFQTATLVKQGCTTLDLSPNFFGTDVCEYHGRTLLTIVNFFNPELPTFIESINLRPVHPRT